MIPKSFIVFRKPDGELDAEPWTQEREQEDRLLAQGNTVIGFPSLETKNDAINYIDGVLKGYTYDMASRHR